MQSGSVFTYYRKNCKTIKFTPFYDKIIKSLFYPKDLIKRHPSENFQEFVNKNMENTD